MNKPNPSPAHAPDALVKQLTKVLADTYVLAVKTHGAHWNVKGPGFFRLHPVFDEQYHELLLAADDIAERIRALDCMAPASMRQLLDSSSLGEPASNEDMVLVRALRDDHRLISNACRAAAASAQEAKDDATADLLVERAKAHDKTAWMLTATLGE
jgi:starvation-inducible DNA-binding protein